MFEGIEYRSRGEGKWAVFFTHLQKKLPGFSFDYEPTWDDRLPVGALDNVLAFPWSIDFIIKNGRKWIYLEMKPDEVSEEMRLFLCRIRDAMRGHGNAWLCVGDWYHWRAPTRTAPTVRKYPYAEKRCYEEPESILDVLKRRFKVPATVVETAAELAAWWRFDLRDYETYAGGVAKMMSYKRRRSNRSRKRQQHARSPSSLFGWASPAPRIAWPRLREEFHGFLWDRGWRKVRRGENPECVASQFIPAFIAMITRSYQLDPAQEARLRDYAKREVNLLTRWKTKERYDRSQN